MTATDDRPEGAFTWPDHQELLHNFIPRAHLVEHGQYLKVALNSDPSRVITIWMDEDELAGGREMVREAAEALYGGLTLSDGVAAVMSVNLYELLESISDGTTDIAFGRRRAFYFVN